MVELEVETMEVETMEVETMAGRCDGVGERWRRS